MNNVNSIVALVELNYQSLTFRLYTSNKSCDHLLIGSFCGPIKLHHVTLCDWLNILANKINHVTSLSLVKNSGPIRISYVTTK